ncbi:MAG: T9SS type A sorting domain-containing protein [Bacteroidales bacterium]|nr:T9SS type A sorting domain-containing protein [Bacteroidales bacterium]
MVYPNPAKEKVHFVFGLYHDLEINIYGLNGEEVFSGSFLHSATINISKFKPGVYPYTIKGKNGFFEKGKLVKQ